MAKQQQQQLMEMQREQARTEGELAKIVSKLESDKLQDMIKNCSRSIPRLCFNSSFLLVQIIQKF